MWSTQQLYIYYLGIMINYSLILILSIIITLMIVSYSGQLIEKKYIQLKSRTFKSYNLKTSDDILKSFVLK
jgi:hypothetical protein